MLDPESMELCSGERSLGEHCWKGGSLPRVGKNACAQLVGSQSSLSVRAHATALSFLHRMGVWSIHVCLELLQSLVLWWSSLRAGETCMCAP